MTKVTIYKGKLSEIINQMKEDMKMEKIWLVVKNKSKGFTYTKYFETEFEKDTYKRRILHVPYLLIIEDSSDINWNYN